MDERRTSGPLDTPDNSSKRESPRLRLSIAPATSSLRHFQLADLTGRQRRGMTDSRRTWAVEQSRDFR